ncbi:ParB N-terminal domain-containing protein [Paenibacillus sp. QZ-Y1]|uniref:ParB/RepB/Spo0J family partition protein n=1 Tax=Paenibacillus sp. QZ-Y1 TaxID=3414511 RepID=UPI003F793725
MKKINIDKLKPHPKNKFYFTDITGKKYKEIKHSINTYGIRDPLKITPSNIIISGHQRLRIAIDLGWNDVPVEIIDIDEMQIEYLLIAENTERRGEAELDPIKKGRQAAFLKEYWGITNNGNKRLKTDNMKSMKDVAEMIGEKSQRTTQRIMKLNDLIPEIQSFVSDGSIGVRTAEELAHLTKEEQKAIYNFKINDISKLTGEESKRIRTEVEHNRGKKTINAVLKSLTTNKKDGGIQQEADKLAIEINEENKALREENEKLKHRINDLEVIEQEYKVLMSMLEKARVQAFVGVELGRTYNVENSGMVYFPEASI